MNGFHEDHADDCECARCAAWMADFYREQREEEAKDLAEELKREKHAD